MNEEKFLEIKTRVIENQYTREDVLELVSIVESLETEVEEFVAYVLDEADLQGEEDDCSL